MTHHRKNVKHVSERRCDPHRHFAETAALPIGMAVILLRAVTPSAVSAVAAVGVASLHRLPMMLRIKQTENLGSPTGPRPNVEPYKEMDDRSWPD
jgi:hypothetical protein